jgi:hypothetical protein
MSPKGLFRLTLLALAIGVPVLWLLGVPWLVTALVAGIPVAIVAGKLLHGLLGAMSL